jgi:hypothetical protein
VEAGSPFRKCVRKNLACILIAKPVPTFAEYAPGYGFEIGERNSGVARLLRRPFRVVNSLVIQGGRGDATCMSAFREQ